MAILNQQKSTFVPVVRIVNIIFFYFFSFVELARQFHVLVRFSFCKMTRRAMIFLKIVIFLKKHPFSYKIAFSTLQIPKEFWWH